MDPGLPGTLSGIRLLINVGEQFANLAHRLPHQKLGNALQALGIQGRAYGIRVRIRVGRIVDSAHRLAQKVGNTLCAVCMQGWPVR